jgi:hypothetical protein
MAMAVPTARRCSALAEHTNSHKTLYDFVAGAEAGTLEVKEKLRAKTQTVRYSWKIENEGFNVLKNNGYCLEHNFGRGKDRLRMLFAAMNLLAFAFHTVRDITEARWRKAREAKGSRDRFFEHR